MAPALSFVPADAGILAMTGSTEGVGLGAEVVVVVGAADVAGALPGESYGSGRGLRPCMPPASRPQRGLRHTEGACGVGAVCAAAVIGVPCRSLTIVRLHRLTCVHALVPRRQPTTIVSHPHPERGLPSTGHRGTESSVDRAVVDRLAAVRGGATPRIRGLDVDDRSVRGNLRPAVPQITSECVAAVHIDYYAV